MHENIDKFISSAHESIADETFVKLTLANYKGEDAQLQRILVRLVESKKGTRLFVQFKYLTRDVVKNYAIDEGIQLVADFLASGFRNGHLFTTAKDFQLDIGKRNSRLNVGKPTIKSPPPLAHDRQKNDLVDRTSFYLTALGITTDGGEIRAQQFDKWKQINKFVEILNGLFERSHLAEKKRLKIVDMGSGKGYLTFAAYEHFTREIGIEVQMIGVDTKVETIALCNGIAETSGFDGLRFVNSTIDEFDPGDADILIALHACDTATDDALAKGIKANADIIVAAPCCHRELRQQIATPDVLSGILKHSVMLDRMAETLTDGIRSMLLERSGYQTKLFEFIAVEHTPKNNMLVGTFTGPAPHAAEMDEQIKAIMDLFGIRRQHLAASLAAGPERLD
ncbi:SAM-dependent methyltransferase [soil metagenome]